MRFLTFLRIYEKKCLRPGHYIGQEWEIQSKLAAFLLELLDRYDTEICVLACVLILLGNAQHCFINKLFLHSVFKMQALKHSISLNIFLRFHSSTVSWSKNVSEAIFEVFFINLFPTLNLQIVCPILLKTLGKKKKPKAT